MNLPALPTTARAPPADPARRPAIYVIRALYVRPRSAILLGGGASRSSPFSQRHEEETVAPVGSSAHGRIVAALRRATIVSGALIASALMFVGPAVPRVAAEVDATNCILPYGGSMGAIDYDNNVRPIETVKAIMLFVDFPDAPAADPADNLFEQYFSPQVHDWMSASSYGKVNLAITPLRRWLRMPQAIADYATDGESLDEDADNGAQQYIEDALDAANPYVNFSQYEIVYIVPNKEETLFTRADMRTYDPSEAIPIDGTLVRTVVTIGSTIWDDGFGTVDHETGHAFGLPDYYADNGTSDSTWAWAGNWSIMSDDSDHDDNFAWDKWRMGWLTNDQIACVNDPTDDDYALGPVGANDGALKAIVLRTGLQTAIVA
jgi:M6 family metalloprotease-like protein